MLWLALKQIKIADYEVQAKAAKELGRHKNPQAVAALIEALNDPHRGVALKAAESLGHIGELALMPLCPCWPSSASSLKA